MTITTLNGVKLQLVFNSNRRVIGALAPDDTGNTVFIKHSALNLIALETSFKYKTAPGVFWGPVELENKKEVVVYAVFDKTKKFVNYLAVDKKTNKRKKVAGTIIPAFEFAEIMSENEIISKLANKDLAEKERIGLNSLKNKSRKSLSLFDKWLFPLSVMSPEEEEDFFRQLRS